MFNKLSDKEQAWGLVMVIVTAVIVTLIVIGFSQSYSHAVNEKQAPVKPLFLTGYKERHCNDIVRGLDGVLVCEINMKAADDDIRIFEGEHHGSSANR